MDLVSSWPEVLPFDDSGNLLVPFIGTKMGWVKSELTGLPVPPSQAVSDAKVALRKSDFDAGFKAGKAVTSAIDLNKVLGVALSQINPDAVKGATVIAHTPDVVSAADQTLSGISSAIGALNPFGSLDKIKLPLLIGGGILALALIGRGK